MLPSLAEVPAPARLRAAAWIVDCLIVIPLGLALGFAGASALRFGKAPGHPPGSALALALVALVLVAYHGILVGLTGQTFGKALFNLRVMRIRKRPPGILWSTGRAVGYLFIDVFGIGSAWALRDRRNRCFHDLVFHSEVVFLKDSPLKARNLLHRLELSLGRKDKRFPTLRRLLNRLVRMLGITELMKRLLGKLTGRAEAATLTGSPASAAAPPGAAGAASAVSAPSAMAAASVLSVSSTAVMAAVTTTVTVGVLLTVPTGLRAVEPLRSLVLAQSLELNPHPRSIDFGNQLVGVSSVPRTVQIDNPGTMTLRVDEARIEGRDLVDFRLSSDGCSRLQLEPEEHCGIVVQFLPGAKGERIANLVISKPGAPLEVRLAGNGTSPGLSAEPATVDFRELLVGNTSRSQTITVSNVGSTPTRIRSVQRTGPNPGDFAIAGDGCSGALLPAAAHCALQTTFAPTAQGGRSASLAVEDDLGSSSTVALVGTGSVSAGDTSDMSDLTAEPTRLDFDERPVDTRSPSRTVTIRGVARQPTVIRTADVEEIASEGRANFAVTSEDCSTRTLAPQDICTLNVVFTPSAEGGHSALLVLRYGDGHDTLTIALSGAGSRTRSSASPAPSPTRPQSPGPLVDSRLDAAAVLLDGVFFTGGWGGTQRSDKETVIDGVFLPKGHQWDRDTVWWDESDGNQRDVVVELGGTYIVRSLIAQVDNNDEYVVSYWDAGTRRWVDVWNIASIPGWGMYTRPNPDDDSERYVLPKPVVTNALRITGRKGDHYYSVSEIQAYGLK